MIVNFLYFSAKIFVIFFTILILTTYMLDFQHHYQLHPFTYFTNILLIMIKNNKKNYFKGITF